MGEVWQENESIPTYDVTVTWNNNTLSEAFDIVGSNVVGFIVPDSFDAVELTFYAATTFDGDYKEVRKGGEEYKYGSIDPYTGAHYDIGCDFPISVRYCKLLADQAITNSITLATRG